jgi:hypothetical protein
MQTLVFNSTERTVKIYQGSVDSLILFSFQNVPTVKSIPDSNYYEVMQKKDETSTVPVFRAPMANTNMLIEK